MDSYFDGKGMVMHKMRFWPSIFLAAFIVVISSFALSMSAAGLDMFSPVQEPKNETVLPTFLETPAETERQRSLIVKQEVSGQASASTAGAGIPESSNSLDNFATVKEIPKPEESEQLLDRFGNPVDENGYRIQGNGSFGQTSQNGQQTGSSGNETLSFDFAVKMKANYNAVILDANKKVVRTLYKDTPIEQGSENLTWDKKDDSGKLVPPGNYSFELNTNSPAVPVLIYHHFSEKGKGYDDNPYTESVEIFSAQMDFLANNGYTVVSLPDLVQYMQGNLMLPAKSVAITLDDGYKSVYTEAFPILKKHNFIATAFIIGRKAEGKQVDFVPSLNFDELRELYQSNIFDIQAHTYDLHNKVMISTKGEFGYAITVNKYLADLKRMETDEEFNLRITEDLRTEKELLESNVGSAVLGLSWPHGRNLDKVTQIAKNLGYKYFFEGNLGPNYIGDSTANIKRTFVKKGVTGQAFAKNITFPTQKAIISTVNFSVR